MMKRLIGLAALLLSAWAATPAAAAGDFDAALAAIQSQWAEVNYATPDDRAALAGFEALAERAHAFSAAHPDRAEPLAWEGIVLSSWAGRKGGLGALKLAKQARTRLEAAEDLDPQVLQGSVYTSLGALYYKVPGWPLGFGSEKRAREYLEKALAVNPDGIDPNYFYGDFLLEHHDYTTARKYLEKALAAPDRDGRASADAGRRAEIRSRLDQLEEASG